MRAIKGNYLSAWPDQIYEPAYSWAITYPSRDSDGFSEQDTIGLLDYHVSIVNQQLYLDLSFDPEHFALEEDRLRQTLAWARAHQPDFLIQLARRMKTYFRDGDGAYRGDNHYADYAGRTLLHWQVLCGRITEDRLVDPAYWEPLLDRCLSGLGAYPFGVRVFSYRYYGKADRAAEKDLQDLLHWAYQEQRKGGDAKQRADRLLENIYNAVRLKHRDPSSEIWDGRKLIHWAVLCKQFKAIDALAAENPALLREKTRRHPLNIAIQIRDIALVEHLLAKGAHPAIKSSKRCLRLAPIHQAVLTNQMDVLVSLVEKTNPRIDLDLYTEIYDPSDLSLWWPGRCCTALIYAARLHRWDMVIYLLEKGADPTAKNGYGETVLHYAADGVSPKVDRLSQEEIETYLGLLYRVEGVQNAFSERIDAALTPSAAKVKLMALLSEHFGEEKSFIAWQGLLQSLKAFRVLGILGRHEKWRSLKDIKTRNTGEGRTCSQFNQFKVAAQVIRSQKVAHYMHSGSLGLPLLSEAEASRTRKDDSGYTRSQHPGQNLKIFYDKLERLHYLAAGISSREKEGIDPKNWKKALEDHLSWLAQAYPDSLIEMVLRPLLQYHAHPPEDNGSNKEPRCIFVSHFANRGLPGVNGILSYMLSSQDVCELILREEISAEMTYTCLSIADQHKIPLDLKQERKLCRSILAAGGLDEKILASVRARLSKLRPVNAVDRQVMNIDFYFKRWRISHANKFVGFFKEKRTNSQRSKQLALLGTVKTIYDYEAKLGLLVTISEEIGKEWNVFDSELKEQIDRILTKNLANSKSGTASEIKQSWKSAYEASKAPFKPAVLVGGATKSF